MFRKFLRIILKATLALVTILVLLVAALTVALRIESVRDAIVEWGYEEFTDATGWGIEVLHIKDLSLTRLSLQEITLVSPDGASAYVHTMDLSFVPWQLLLGRAHFSHFIVDGFHWMPTSSKTPKEVILTRPTFFPWAWIIIDIAHFELNSTEIPLELLPERLAHIEGQQFNILGSLQFSARHRSAMIETQVMPTATPDLVTFLAAYFSLHQDTVEVHTRISEERAALIGQALDLSESLCFEATASASAPLNELAASLISGVPHEDLLVDGDLQAQVYCVDDDDEDLAFEPWPFENISLLGDYRWSGRGGLTFDHLQVVAEHDDKTMTMQGTFGVDHDFDRFRSQFEVDIDDLTVLKPLGLDIRSGSLQGNGMLSGLWGSPSFDIHVEASEPSTEGGYTVEQLKIHAKGDVTSQDTHFAVALSAPVGPVATNANFKFAWDYGPKIQLSDIQWHSPTTALHGQLDIILGDRVLLDGTLEGDTGDLSWLEPFVDAQVHGSGNIKLELKVNEDSRQDLGATFELNQISWNKTHIAQLHFDALIRDVFSRPTGTMALHLDNATLSNSRIKELKLSVVVPEENIPWLYEIQAHGKSNGRFRLTGDGQFVASLQEPALTVEHLDARLQSEALRLVSPWMAVWTDKGIQVSDLDLQVGTGKLKGLFATNPVGPSLHFEAASIPIDLFHPWFEYLPPSGLVSGSFDVGGSWKAPTAQFSFSISDMHLWHSGRLDPALAKAELEGHFVNNLFEARGNVTGIGDKPIVLSAKLPVTWTLYPWEFDLPENETFSVEIDAQGEVSSLLQLVVPDATSFTGSAHIALDVAGTYEHPLVTGSLDLRNCVYEGLDTGSVFRNIEAKLKGTGRDIILTELSADDGKQGHLSGHGKIKLDTTQGLPFELDLNINNALVLSRDYLDVTATGNLKLFGSTQNVALEGTLDVNTMDITLPDELPTPAASLDIIYVHKRDQDTNQTHGSKAPISRPIKLNVAVNVPNKAFIHSRELNSEWQGDFVVSGTSKKPLIHGELQLLQGDYWISGRAFWLTKGSIRLDGNFEKNTSLYVIAAQSYDRYTIEVVAKGPLRSPSITLRSNPYLSQREIASWLVFNKGLDEASPFEQDVADEFAIDLHSKSSQKEPGVMDRLRHFGIDRIDLYSQHDPDHQDVSVNIGKYLSKDVYVSVNRGINTDSNRVKLEANIIRHVKFHAELNDQATSRLQLMWKHDY